MALTARLCSGAFTWEVKHSWLFPPCFGVAAAGFPPGKGRGCVALSLHPLKDAGVHIPHLSCCREGFFPSLVQVRAFSWEPGCCGMMEQRDASWPASSSLPPFTHTCSHLGVGFVYRNTSKKVFPIAPRRGTFSATQSPSNCEGVTYQLHKINLFR